MNEIIIGKIMKVDKLQNPYLMDSGNEFYLSFEQGELVEVTKYNKSDSDSEFKSYLCVDKNGEYQNVPYRYLKECSIEEEESFDKVEVQTKKLTKLDIVEMELDKTLKEVEKLKLKLEKMKKKQKEKDIEIILLKKELLKYEN